MKGFSFKKAIPALALALVLVGSFVTYRLWPDNSLSNNAGLGNGKQEQQLAAGDRARDGAAEDATDDLAAPYLDEFKFEGRNYYLLYDESRKMYNLPEKMVDEDIGKKIGTIKESGNSKLVGCDIYEYIPAGGNAFVAVKQGDEYKLYKFINFESYVNNQDEDAVKYLELYGINKASDILKVQFIGYSEKSKLEGRTEIIAEITDKADLEKFYNYYSALKNSSDKYFEKLFNYRKELEESTGRTGEGREPGTDEIPPVDPALPPDYVAPDLPTGYAVPRPEPVAPEYIAEPAAPAQDDVVPDPAYDLPTYNTPQDAPSKGGEVPVDSIIDTGNGGTSSNGSEPGAAPATDALANAVTIRIYNKSGVYFDTEYYRNMGFISRYEISAEFKGFLEGFIK